ncbi:MAG: rhodanese-like domain-containing protein [Bacteroidota bacterium]
MDSARRYLLPAIIVLIAFIGFQLFTGGGETEPTDDVVEAIAAGAQVIDARSDGEYASGHIDGAVHANVLSGGFRQRVDGLEREETVYVYCASGTRSGRAASILEEMGFARVVNAGGLAELQRAGAPVTR